MEIYIFSAFVGVALIVGGLALIVALERTQRHSVRSTLESATAPQTEPQRGDFSALTENSIEGRCSHV